MKLLYFQFIFSTFIYSQQTTIGLQYFDKDVSEGYILFSPLDYGEAYLINNCGQVVHEWPSDLLANYANYLLEDGSMIRLASEYVEKKSWDNEILWRYTLNTENTLLHHDIEPLPNGNVLLIAYDVYTREDAIAKGRHPENIVDDLVRSEKIIEIKPSNMDSFEIVWEWKLWDHLIQNTDSTKPNFGEISGHPERFDINFDYLDSNGMSDWLHVNGLDYNVELDQIIFSSRHTSELYIIDHSTSTEEASGSSGGLSNKGGDFLWRWGNPIIYHSGILEDQKLFGQHDPQWILSGFPEEGGITVFNNRFGNGTKSSSVHIINSSTNEEYLVAQNNQFFPFDFSWSFTGVILGTPLESAFRSGVHSIFNGNMLLTEAQNGRMIEIRPNGEILWVYTCPIGEGNPIQYNLINSQLFKAIKYSKDYPAFQDKDLSNGLILEDENPMTEDCLKTSVSSEELTQRSKLKVYPTVSSDYIFVESQNPIQKIEIFNLNGKRILLKEKESRIDVSDILQGSYILKVFTENETINTKVVVM